MSKPQTDRNIQIPNGLIRELLTDSELRMVKRRFLILDLFGKKLSVRTIAEAVGVGTDTVMRVSRLATKRPVLRGYFQKSESLSSPSRPKWVFGQAKTEEE